MTTPSEAADRAGAELKTIAPEDWETFLEQFTEFNEEMPVRVEETDPSGAQRVLAEGLPLLSVSLDREAGEEYLIVECGGTEGEAPPGLRHIVHQPLAVRARRSEPVGWDLLEIESREQGAVRVTVLASE